MIRFITGYRDRFGVELTCRVLRPAVHGFFVLEVARLHAENYGVCGRRKMHALMRWQR